MGASSYGDVRSPGQRLRRSQDRVVELNRSGEERELRSAAPETVATSPPWRRGLGEEAFVCMVLIQWQWWQGEGDRDVREPRPNGFRAAEKKLRRFLLNRLRQFRAGRVSRVEAHHVRFHPPRIDRY